MAFVPEKFQPLIADRLFRQAHWLHLLALVPLLLILMLLRERVTEAWLIPWGVTMVALELALTAVAQLYLWRPERPGAAPTLHLYLALHLLISVCWVLPVMLAADVLTVWQLVALSVALFAIAAGALSTLSWYWPAYVWGNVCMLLPLAGMLLVRDSAVLQGLGGLSLILLALLAVISQREYRERLELLEMERANARMDTNLQQQNRELTSIKHVLRRLQETDSLTGLMALDKWKARFTQQAVTAPSLVVCFADLRHFRKVNQRWGAAVGDQVIQALAERLVTALGHENVSHVSADEFVFWLPLEDTTRVADLAERIVRYLNLPMTLAPEVGVLVPEAVIGAALYPQHSQDVETLVEYASLANHHCKRTGLHQSACIFETELATSTHYHIDIEMALKWALKAGELELLFQPQVTIDGGRVVGAETLLRWHNGILGTVSPADFIPVAERSGLILEIGAWVLERACETLAHWQSQFGDRLHLAVNVSAVQLVSGDVADQIAACIKRYGLFPGGLHVEVTESAIMANPDIAIQTIRRIRAQGVAIALDDFGTGYSSLSYFRTLEIDYLKLDQSFIRNIHSSSKDYAIVEAVIYMAKACALQVIAEGIETEDGRRLLATLGCDLGQGWLFGRPMRQSALMQLFRESPASAPSPLSV